MAHFLESKRLYFKGIELSDLSDKYVAWMNDPEISQFMETWHFPHTRDNIEAYIKAHTDNRNEPFFGIILKESQSIDELKYVGEKFGVPSLSYEVVKKNIPIDRHIGNIKLGPINFIHRYAHVSLFICEKDLRGKGYGPEAIKLLTDYAFKRLGLHKLRAGIYCRNVASINAFKKAGFEFEAELRDHVWFNGEWISIYLMGKINV